jgi:AhpD family alkylhydroperoxidase
MGETGGTALAAMTLAGGDASFARALQLLSELGDRDDALPTAVRDVLAVAMAAVVDPERCRVETQRAVGSGMSAQQVRALARALYLSRGERPARTLLAALASFAADPPDHGAGDAVEPIEPATMVAAFTEAFGELPARVSLLVEHSPEGLEAYHRMRVAVLAGESLPTRLAELVLFAVNAADHRDDHASVHAKGARRAGVAERELVAAGLATISFGGVAAWLAASEAIAATRPTGPDEGDT